MKTLLRYALLFVAGAGLAFSAEGRWTTDFAAAKVRAKAENKALLLDFTGSDWCPWCVKMEKEVFSKQKFLDYADKNLVLVRLDFPKHKSLPPALVSQNEALFEKYRVRGMPTIMVLSSKGKEIGNTGYAEGGLNDYLGILDDILKRD
jgi:protein disulfide-isomerase